MDGFPADISPFIGLGGWLSVIVLVLLSMFRGWLIPGPIHKQIIQSYEKQLLDKDRQISLWTDSYKASDARADLQANSIHDLLDVAKDTNENTKALIRAYIPTQKEHIQ